MMPLAPYKFQLKVLPSFRAVIWPAAIPPFLHVFDNTKTTTIWWTGRWSSWRYYYWRTSRRSSITSRSKRMRTSMRGHDYIHELLKSGNHERIHQVLRMRYDTFMALRDWLRAHTALKSTKEMTVEEKLAIFCWKRGKLSLLASFHYIVKSTWLLIKQWTR